MYEELVKALRHCVKRPRYSCGECKSYVMAACLDEEEPIYTCDGKLFSQAADAIEELQRQIDGWIEQERKALIKSLPRWIPVTERLPEDGMYVLGRYKNNEMVVVCVFDHDEDFAFWRSQTNEGWETACDTEPTHWLPIPEPPKEET